MAWKLLYIVTAWPMIGVVELLGLFHSGSGWAHKRMIAAGIRWTKFCNAKVGK